MLKLSKKQERTLRTITRLRPMADGEGGDGAADADGDGADGGKGGDGADGADDVSAKAIEANFASLTQALAEAMKASKSSDNPDANKALEALQTQLTDATAQLTQYREKELADKRAKMSEHERAMDEAKTQKAAAEKRAADLEAALETTRSGGSARIDALTATVNSLASAHLDNRLLMAAATNNAYSSEQVMRMLRSDFTFDETAGSHVCKATVDGKEVVRTPEEHVAAFLKDPANANLTRLNSTPRPAGATQQSAAADSGAPKGKEDSPDGGKLGEKNKSGELYLGRQLTRKEAEAAQAGGFTHMQYGSLLASTEIGQKALEARKAEHLKSANSPLPGEIQL